MPNGDFIDLQGSYVLCNGGYCYKAVMQLVGYTDVRTAKLWQLGEAMSDVHTVAVLVCPKCQEMRMMVMKKKERT